MFSTENTVMILIDVQGKLATLMHEREQLYKSLETIVKSMKILEVPIIWLEQVPESLGPTVEEISKYLTDMTPIAKHTFSCCDNREFTDTFNALNRNQVLLTGIETHICIFQTAFDLIRAGYQVQVITEGVSSRTVENKEIGLGRIKQAGGVVTSIEMILFELMKSTKANGFRDVVRLIK